MGRKMVSIQHATKYTVDRYQYQTIPADAAKGAWFLEEILIRFNDIYFRPGSLDWTNAGNEHTSPFGRANSEDNGYWSCRTKFWNKSTSNVIVIIRKWDLLSLDVASGNSSNVGLFRRRPFQHFEMTVNQFLQFQVTLQTVGNIDFKH